MPEVEAHALPNDPQGANFATTHWSVVHAAATDTSPEAQAALEILCRTYWYPLYAYIRRRGHDPHDAQDLTQEFFASLVARNFLKAVRQERGRFRAFLLMSVRRFLVNEWHHENAAKRGGGRRIVSLDETTAEGRYLSDVAEAQTPETLFDRSWAMTVLENAKDRLQEEYNASGRGPLFDHLKVFLSGDRAVPPYADAGAAIGMSEGAVKVAVHRLRQRYRDCLRQQIAQTVCTTTEIDEEIRQLFAAFSR